MRDGETSAPCGAKPALERGARLDHLRNCTVCRARLVADDPSRLFSLLALVTPEPDWSASLTSRLNAKLEELEGRRPRWLATRGQGLAAAASLALAALLGLAVLRSSDRSEVASLAAAPELEVAAPTRSVPPRPAATGSMDLLTPADADVVRFEVGETTLVMIFDKSLEL